MSLLPSPWLTSHNTSRSVGVSEGPAACRSFAFAVEALCVGDRLVGGQGDPLGPGCMKLVVAQHVTSACDWKVLGGYGIGHAVGASAEMWARHGAQHPLGEDFSGAQVPASLLREICLHGKPDEVIEQAAHWRDHGVRYTVVANVSALQPSLRKGIAAAAPFAAVLRGLRKL
jgi:hypothetical protein